MRTIPAALALALLSCAATARAQPGQSIPADVSVVITSGEAIVKRPPDRAFVALAAESRAKTSKDAQRMNADAMTSVLARLKAAGIVGEAIQTTSVDLQPEFDYAGGKQTLRGYLARNSVDVRVDDLSKLGDVIDAAVTGGATSVSGVRFDLKDRSGAEREALQHAVEDARSRATAAAAGAGMCVERVIRIEEARAGDVVPPRPMMAMRAEAAAAPVTPVVPGDLEIRASVTLTVAVR